MNYEDYYDDYYGEEGGFIKNKSHKKKKFKGKGHQSRKSESERWSEIIEASGEEDDGYSGYSSGYSTSAENYHSRSTHSYTPSGQTYKSNSEPKKFVANPETTKNIKGVDIDFGGVVAMAKEESDAKGFRTYGIRFTFKGSKGLYRIVWFNKNQYLRDKLFDENKAYWDSLQAKGGTN